MRRPTLASLHLSTNLYNFWNGLFFLVNKKYASTTPKRPWSHYVSVATPFGRAKLVSLTKVPFGMSLRLKLVIFILILVRRRNVSDRNTKHSFSTFFLIQFFEVNLLPKFVFSTLTDIYHRQRNIFICWLQFWHFFSLFLPCKFFDKFGPSISCSQNWLKFNTEVHCYTSFFCKKNFITKWASKTKNLKKMLKESLRPHLAELQFLRKLTFPRVL